MGNLNYTGRPDRLRRKEMSMRTIPPNAAVYAAIVLGVALIAPASAAPQEPSTLPFPQGPSQHKRVLGIMDQKTGEFKALPVEVPEATTPITGTITVTLHITLKTTVPTGGKVACSADLLASFETTTGSTQYSEDAGAFATVSGTTATCTLIIPHSWLFPARTTTSVEILNGGYSAEIINPSTATNPELLVFRQSSSDFVSLEGNNIFATAPTAFSVNVTL
jgi:hypothetical protein